MSIEQWLPGSVGVLLCVWVAVWFARLGFRAVGARSWPAVQGHVVSCVIERGRRMSARARIRYEYQVEGQTLSGDTLFFGDFFDANQAIAEERLVPRAARRFAGVALSRDCAGDGERHSTGHRRWGVTSWVLPPP